MGRCVMSRWVCAGSVAVLCAAGTGFAAGDEKPQVRGQMYMVYVDQVKPAMMGDYEDATKYMVKELEAYEIDPHHVNFKAMSGPEIGYLFVMPIENFAAVDEMQKHWRAAVEKIGIDKWKEMAAASDAAVDSREILYTVHRPDLSYQPKDPHVDPDDVKYVSYDFYYCTPGKEEALEAVAKKYIELYRKNDLESGWNVYESITGADLPLYVVEFCGSSKGDFVIHDERNKTILGEAGERLDREAMACVRRLEQKEAWLRPDLSYPRHDSDAKHHDHDAMPEHAGQR